MPTPGSEPRSVPSQRHSAESEHELRRLVRIAIPTGALRPPGPVDNAFASWPSTENFAVRFDVEVGVRGSPDPVTGYLVDIGTIDRAVRTIILRAATPAATPPLRHTGAILRLLLDELPAIIGLPVATVTLHFAPYLQLRIQRVSSDRILLRQSFEFSASHRLHCPDYDDARNRELFGKCNNPNGHGHNYRLEVAVAVSLVADGTTAPALTTIESIVRTAVIDRLDHTHLNLDVDVFRSLNPSVENIARVCHDWLREPLGAIGGELRSVTLWETGKTCCQYPVPALG